MTSCHSRPQLTLFAEFGSLKQLRHLAVQVGDFSLQHTQLFRLRVVPVLDARGATGRYGDGRVGGGGGGGGGGRRGRYCGSHRNRPDQIGLMKQWYSTAVQTAFGWSIIGFVGIMSTLG